MPRVHRMVRQYGYRAIYLATDSDVTAGRSSHHDEAPRARDTRCTVTPVISVTPVSTATSGDACYPRHHIHTRYTLTPVTPSHPLHRYTRYTVTLVTPLHPLHPLHRYNRYTRYTGTPVTPGGRRGGAAALPAVHVASAADGPLALRHFQSVGYHDRDGAPRNARVTHI